MAKPKLDSDQMTVWRNRLVRSARAKKNHVKKWDVIREFYRGNYFSYKSDEDRYCVNWVFSVVRQMMSVLYFQNPTMVFKPMSVQGEVAAPIMEGVTQYERRIIDSELEERDVLFNALMYGTGIMKHGYNAEFGVETPMADEKVDLEEQSKYMPLMGSDGSAITDDTVLKQGVATEHNTGISEGHPWVCSIKPWDFFIDTEAETVKEARWMAHRFYRPWVDVVRDERYDKEARKSVKATGHSQWLEDDIGTDPKDSRLEDSSLVCLYEIWDKPTQTIIVVTDICDVPLMVTPYPFFMKEGPYEVLQFFPSQDADFWALSYVDMFLPQAVTLNKLRTRMMDHLERWGATKGAIKKGSVSNNDLERWAKSKTNEIIEINASDDIGKIISMFPNPPITGDAWRLSDLFRDDLDQISGVSELSRGSGGGVNTATEASYIQQQTGLRVGDMRYLFERFLRNSTRRVVQLLRQFWPSQRVVPIVGPEGQIWDMLNVSRELVQAEYDVDIEPGSTERYDKSVRVRQCIDAMAQLTPMVPYLQQSGYDINWPELVKLYLRNTDLFRNPERVMVKLPPPQPMPMQPSMGAGQPQMGMDPNAMQEMTPQPEMVNNMGQMPQQMGAGINARTFSDFFNSQRAPVAV